MRLKRLIAGTIMAGTLAGAALPAFADELFVPLFSYRTGPYAGSGIPIANGMHDYLAMLNERDGGINGVKIRIEECETGYDTQKGVECYEQVKGDGALVISPYSTGITLQVIPKASVDKIPVLSMAYGLSAAAEGNTFPWVFNPPDTYWDGASAIITDIVRREGGGADALKGKKIGYIFLDAGYGREPIPLLENLAQKYGFEVLQYPVPGKEMQNQSSQWLSIRRDRPDYVVMWGWGAMNPTAIKEAVKNRFDMSKFIGVWWAGGDEDARAGGAGAKGYKSVSFNNVGADYPALQDIKKLVVDAGKSGTPASTVGENLYNRGVVNAVYMVEAIRTAQEMTGKKVINAEDMRVGLENLKIDEARLEAIGLKGMIAPIEITCANHSGHHSLFIQEWDGEKWTPATDWFSPMTEEVTPILMQASKDYATSNAPWPTREDACPAN